MKQKILDATHGGLDVILSYYPQAREVIDGKAKHFKARPSEKTASATLREFQGVWYVTDFGDDQTGRNCFDVAMKEENLPFAQTLHLLAQRFNVDFSLKAEINRPDVVSGKATKDDLPFTYITHEPTKAELAVFGEFVTPKVLEQYNYYALESYTTCKDGKKNNVQKQRQLPYFSARLWQLSKGV